MILSVDTHSILFISLSILRHNFTMAESTKRALFYTEFIRKQDIVGDVEIKIAQLTARMHSKPYADMYIYFYILYFFDTFNRQCSTM